MKGDAQELVASRVLKNAAVIRYPDWPATLEALKAGNVDAVAGNSVTLPTTAQQLPGSRILEGRFEKQELVVFVPKGKPAALAFVRDFVKQGLASGLLQQIVDRDGRPGLKVGSGK